MSARTATLSIMLSSSHREGLRGGGLCSRQRAAPSGSAPRPPAARRALRRRRPGPDMAGDFLIVLPARLLPGKMGGDSGGRGVRWPACGAGQSGGSTVRMRHALTAGAVVLAAALAAAGPRIAAEAAAGSPATTKAPAVINWGKPWFTDNFNATKVNPKWWWVYNSPTDRTPRTVQSVQEKQGTLRLIAHTQKPYGYVGGGLSFNNP